jgi:hypothetical protein
LWLGGSRGRVTIAATQVLPIAAQILPIAAQILPIRAEFGPIALQVQLVSLNIGLIAGDVASILYDIRRLLLITRVGCRSGGDRRHMPAAVPLQALIQRQWPVMFCGSWAPPEVITG